MVVVVTEAVSTVTVLVEVAEDILLKAYITRFFNAFEQLFNKFFQTT